MVVDECSVEVCCISNINNVPTKKITPL